MSAAPQGERIASAGFPPKSIDDHILISRMAHELRALGACELASFDARFAAYCRIAVHASDAHRLDRFALAAARWRRAWERLAAEEGRPS